MSVMFNSSGSARKGRSRGSRPAQAVWAATGGGRLGRVLVGVTERGLGAVAFGDSDAALQAGLAMRVDEPAAEVRDVLVRALADVRRLIDDPAHALTVDLDVVGSPFQRRVWAALRAIPAGRTVTYAGLAASLGMPAGARAVAAACAANRLAVVIPCHRVVGSDGGLRGYRWGLERKRSLLAIERDAR